MTPPPLLPTDKVPILLLPSKCRISRALLLLFQMSWITLSFALPFISLFFCFALTPPPPSWAWFPTPWLVFHCTCDSYFSNTLFLCWFFGYFWTKMGYFWPKMKSVIYKNNCIWMAAKNGASTRIILYFSVFLIGPEVFKHKNSPRMAIFDLKWAIVDQKWHPRFLQILLYEWQ